MSQFLQQDNRLFARADRAVRALCVLNQTRHHALELCSYRAKAR